MAARGSFPNSSSTASLSFSVGNRTGSYHARSPGQPSRLTLIRRHIVGPAARLFAHDGRPTKCNARPRAKAKHGAAARLERESPNPQALVP